MVGNFLKGLGLSILGLLLWVVFSFVWAFNPSAYGPHVFVGLSFILMVFGPVLFWIVFSLKERCYDKGKSNRFYAVMILIGLIFLIFLGVAFLLPEASISSVTTEVGYRGGNTSMKVTLEGKMNSFDLILSDPEGNTVDKAHIPSSDMSDGRETKWLSMASFQTQAKPGAYLLVVTDSSGNKVYEETLGPYSGSDLSVINIDTTSTFHEYLGYYIESILLTVKNDGDLPAHVTEVDVKIDTIKGSFTIPDEEGVILPGETTTITASVFIPIAIGPFDEGDYSASLKLKEGLLGQWGTVATYTTTISIP